MFAFIGAAQGRLSLGLTKTVPGKQTLDDAIKSGPGHKVPASVLNALRAYMKTPECTTAIAQARMIAEFTIAKFKSSSAPLPKVKAEFTLAELAAASNAAIAQVSPQRKDDSAHDQATTANEVIALFAPELAGPLQIANDLIYAYWGDEGVQFVFGGPFPPPGSDTQDNGHSFIVQTIYDSVTNFMNSSGGSGSTNQDPSHSDQGPTTDNKQN